MTWRDDDPELAAAFAALRREEEEQCPSFAEVRHRAPARSRRSVVHRRSLVAAAALAGIAIAVLAVWVGLRREQPSPSIAEWQSPTEFLLETPGREILSMPYGLGRSVLDLASPTERRSPS